MENATKALIMAATVLVSIMLISLLVFALRKGGQIEAEYDTQISEQEKARFNSQFEIYDGKDNTYFDVITAANLAWDVNKKSGWDNTAGVEVSLIIGTYKYYIAKNVEIEKNWFWKNDTSNKQYMYDNTFIKDNTEKKDVNTDKYRFVCTKIDYSSVTGKVNIIEFKRETN